MSQIRVLLVEDSRADAALAARALECGEGTRFALTVAGSLGEGIDHLVRGFDAILLDLTLPDSVGPETVSRMRAAARELPIIVLSGAADADIADRCVRAGADAFCEKGRFDGLELRHLVSSAIERQEPERSGA